MNAYQLETATGLVIDYGSLVEDDLAKCLAAEAEYDFWASRENEPAYVPGSVVLDAEDELPF